MIAGTALTVDTIFSVFQCSNTEVALLEPNKHFKDHLNKTEFVCKSVGICIEKCEILLIKPICERNHT